MPKSCPRLKRSSKSAIPQPKTSTSFLLHRRPAMKTALHPAATVIHHIIIITGAAHTIMSRRSSIRSKLSSASRRIASATNDNVKIFGLFLPEKTLNWRSYGKRRVIWVRMTTEWVRRSMPSGRAKWKQLNVCIREKQREMVPIPEKENAGADSFAWFGVLHGCSGGNRVKIGVYIWAFRGHGQGS